MRWADVRAAGLVAATYVHFLLFAQFAFLERLQGSLSVSRVQVAMGTMGVAGLLASLVAAWRLDRRAQPARLEISLALAAGVALVTLLPSSGFLWHVVLAGLVGATTGWLTVTLATQLWDLAPGRVGRVAGLGTGLAYLVANLPPLFAGSITLRTVVAAVALLGALMLARQVAPEAAPAQYPGVGRAAGISFVAAAVAFFVLVWLDSAVFAVVQQTPALLEQTWGTPSRALVQGGFHALAAVAAGFALDRGRLRLVLAATFVAFALGFAALEPGSRVLWLAGPIYAIGISAYSTALVAAPSLLSGPRRPWRAAILFGLGGWIGSALGVGMAQDLGVVPRWFVVLAGVAVVLALRSAGRKADLETWLPATLSAALAIALAVIPTGPAAEATGLEPESPAERGRAVYIAEGCISCHSQYVRPRGDDFFGPHRPLDRTAQPPLVGSRRQGPDLTNVGARRPVEFLRAHLIDPRAHNPWSRMPAYPHLFADRRGEDLVAYLATLGPGFGTANSPVVMAP